jgi:hypothetical protein
VFFNCFNLKFTTKITNFTDQKTARMRCFLMADILLAAFAK